jgi:hypothetical protein
MQIAGTLNRGNFNAFVEQPAKLNISSSFRAVDHIHMRLHRRAFLALADAVRRTAAQTAFPDAARALHFPNSRLQADTGNVAAALAAVEVVHVRLQLA